MDIVYIDRASGEQQKEKVYGEWLIKLLYGQGWTSKTAGTLLQALFCKNPYASALAGWWQNLPHTAKAIAPFIADYGIDSQEFLDDVSSYRSFNDFFIRQLKPSARPIAAGENRAIIPADGRYYFYQDIEKADGFVVKGQKFDLTKLLQSKELADKYRHGAMVLARLCPSDYHRFHFACDGIPDAAKPIPGELYSVNPLAIRQNIEIFTQNKRVLTTVETPQFGKVLTVEVGATAVGTIVETYTPGKQCHKGEEKGYFSFGGSSLIWLFPPQSIQFDSDLLAATESGLEIRCLMGQSMGVATE